MYSTAAEPSSKPPDERSPNEPRLERPIRTIDHEDVRRILESESFVELSPANPIASMINRLSSLDEENTASACQTLENLLNSDKMDKKHWTWPGETTLTAAIKSSARPLAPIISTLLKFPKIQESINHDGSPNWRSDGQLPPNSNFEEMKIRQRRLLMESERLSHLRVNQGRTPLSLSVEYATEDVVSLLLSHSADVALCDMKGRQPLSYAAECGETEILKLLFSKGAQIDSKDDVGRTPLSYAAQHGRLDVVKLLLAHDATVGSEDNKGRTPLSYAAENGRMNTAKLLLDHGASVDQKDNTGRTALSWFLRQALEQRNQRVDPYAIDEEQKLMELLLHGQDEPSRQRLTKILVIPELWALATNDDNAGESSTKGGISFDIVLEKNGSLRVSSIGLDEIIYLLLWVEKHRSSPIDKSRPLVSRAWSNRGTMLHEAASCGHASIMAELIRYGAEVNTRNQQEDTPLRVAIRNGNPLAVELLLQHGAEVRHTIMAQDWWSYMKSLGRHPADWDLVLSEEITPKNPKTSREDPQSKLGQPRSTENNLVRRSHKIVKNFSHRDKVKNSQMLM